MALGGSQAGKVKCQSTWSLFIPESDRKSNNGAAGCVGREDGMGWEGGGREEKKKERERVVYVRAVCTHV